MEHPADQATGPIPAHRLEPSPTVDTAQGAPKSRTWLWLIALAATFAIGMAVGSASTGTPAPAPTLGHPEWHSSATPTAPSTSDTMRDISGPWNSPTPTPYIPGPAPAPSGPLTTISDGTYEVGPDIVPGKYKTPGPSSSGILNSCYMEVSDGSGSIRGIDHNDNLTGPGVVTLKAGKYFKASGGCTWTKVG